MRISVITYKTIPYILRKIAHKLHVESSVNAQEALSYLLQHPEKVKRVLLDLASSSRVKNAEFVSVKGKLPNNIIDWEIPDLSKEVGEYLENDATKIFLKSHGVEFKSSEEVLEFLKTGKMVSFSEGDLQTALNLTLNKADFEDELQDPEYRGPFESMEQELLKKGTLRLPSPIFLSVGGKNYCFAGNRRVNLAFKYGLPVKVWLVRVNAQTAEYPKTPMFLSKSAGSNSSRLFSAVALLLAMHGGVANKQAPAEALKTLDTMKQSPQLLQQAQQVPDTELWKTYEKIIDEYRNDPRLLDVLEEGLKAYNKDLKP